MVQLCFSSANIITKHRICITTARFTVVFSCHFEIKKKKSIYRYKLKVYYVDGKVMYVENGRQLHVYNAILLYCHYYCGRFDVEFSRRQFATGEPRMPVVRSYLHTHIYVIVRWLFSVYKTQNFLFLFFYVDPMSRTDTYDTARVEKKNEKNTTSLKFFDNNRRRYILENTAIYIYANVRFLNSIIFCMIYATVMFILMKYVGLLIYCITLGSNNGLILFNNLFV